MEYIKTLIDRYKHIRSLRQLRCVNKGKYAFVGIGSHSIGNLYPVLGYLHVPLKYICCKLQDKLRLIEKVYPHVQATTSLSDILNDDEVKGVFVSVSPKSHFSIASEVIQSGKALFIEKPPCQSKEELLQLIEMRSEANNPIVVVGLQKRCSPVTRILKRNLKKCDTPISYNLRYLMGAYPEGDALMELFIHPLDYVTYLFGKADVKCVENVKDQTLLLVLKHANAAGVLELSTAYSWTDATEGMTINTSKGIYELQQMDSLTFKGKPCTFMGIPMEKILPHQSATIELFGINNSIPMVSQNQIVTQGYFDTIKSFVDAVEGRRVSLAQSLPSLVDTYSLIDEIRLALKQS